MNSISVQEACRFWDCSESEIMEAVAKKLLLQDSNGGIILKPYHYGMRKFIGEKGKKVSDLLKRSYDTDHRKIATINALRIYQSTKPSDYPFVVLDPEGNIFTVAGTAEDAQSACYSNGKYSVRRRNGKSALLIRISIDAQCADELLQLACQNPDVDSIVYIANMVQRHFDRKCPGKLENQLPNSLRYKSE